MNATRMPPSPADFGKKILGYFDYCRFWQFDGAERRFWDEIPRHHTQLFGVAGQGWIAQECFATSVAKFVFYVLRPNLNDEDRGYSFRAAEEMLRWADIQRMGDCPRSEILEFQFYQSLSQRLAPESALADFIRQNWHCVEVTVP